MATSRTALLCKNPLRASSKYPPP